MYSVTLVLIGFYYNFTGFLTAGLQKYHFVDGRIELQGPENDVKLTAQYLARNWQALPEDDPRVAAFEEELREREAAALVLATEGLISNKEPNDGSGQVQDGGAKSDGPTDVQGGVQTDLGGASEDAANVGARDGDTSAGGAGSDPAGDGSATGVSEAPVLKLGEDADKLDTSNEPKPLGNDKLTRAVRGLDPADDSNWTKDGLPAISAVTAAYGATDVTRAQVNAAAPGWTRATAQTALLVAGQQT